MKIVLPFIFTILLGISSLSSFAQDTNTSSFKIVKIEALFNWKTSDTLTLDEFRSIGTIELKGCNECKIAGYDILFYQTLENHVIEEDTASGQFHAQTKKFKQQGFHFSGNNFKNQLRKVLRKFPLYSTIVFIAIKNISYTCPDGSSNLAPNSISITIK